MYTFVWFFFTCNFCDLSIFAYTAYMLLIHVSVNHITLSFFSFCSTWVVNWHLIHVRSNVYYDDNKSVFYKNMKNWPIVVQLSRVFNAEISSVWMTICTSSFCMLMKMFYRHHCNMKLPHKSSFIMYCAIGPVYDVLWCSSFNKKQFLHGYLFYL